MSRPRKGPTVRRQYACPACGHWQCGRSHFHHRPVAYREVEYSGGRGGGIRVLRTVHVDEVRDSGEFLTQVKLIVGRLAEVLGLAIESESKLRTQLDAKEHQLAALAKRVDELVKRADAAKQYRKRKRAKVRAGGFRTSGLSSTPAKAKAGPRRTDGLDAARARRDARASLTDAFSTVFRRSVPVTVVKGEEKEDGL